MRRLWLLLAVLPFLVHADGFPSRPTFQAMYVGQLPAVTKTAAGNAQTISTSGAAPRLMFYDTAGAANNHLWRLFANSGCFSLVATADDISSETALLNGCRSGTAITSVSLGTSATTTVNVRGLTLPKIIAAQVIGGSGALQSGSTNVSGSSRSSTGNYTVTFGTTFTNNPVCTATIATLGTSARVNALSGTTQVSLLTVDDATNAAADATFNVICIGP